MPLAFSRDKLTNVKILLTNDDGIFAESLWTLARELKEVAPVVVVAPDREQSAAGTAVTLTRPLRVRRTRSPIPGIEAHSVEGSPADSVILALEKIHKGDISLVVSGINQGLNVGNDVLISGTVGAALQGYLRGLPAIAISIAYESSFLVETARLGRRLAGDILSGVIPKDVFLNVNVPGLSLDRVGRICLTRLAGKTHIDTVEEGHDGRREYYWLVCRKRDGNDASLDAMTDIGVVSQGNISITQLHAYPFNDWSSVPSDGFTDGLCTEILAELRSGSG